MKVDEEVNARPSILVLIVGALSLLGLGVFGLVIFILALIDLISSLTLYPSSISFHKGAFYGLGGGVMLLLAFSVFIWEVVLKQKSSEKVLSFYPKILIICLVILIGLPHIVHFSYSQHLKSNGYITCNEMSKRWFHDLTVVYVKSDAICEKLIADKKAKSNKLD